MNSIKKITPKKDKRSIGSKDQKSKDKTLVVSTFFLPVSIGQFITIPDSEQTKTYAGSYQVTARRLVLDSRGQAWDVVLECDEV